MSKRDRSAPPAALLRVPGVAFLLSQLGSHSSRLWQERLAPLGLDPRHVVLLRHVAPNLLSTVAVLAPLRRAARIDPARVLREG